MPRLVVTEGPGSLGRVPPSSADPPPSGRTTGRWGPEGPRNGFLFRLVASTAAVFVGSLVLFVAGASNDWRLEDWMLWLMGLIVAGMVLFGEHIRSRAYERRELDRKRTHARSRQVERLLAELGHPHESWETTRRSHRTKRAFDLVVASAAIAFLSPMLLMIAVLVKWDSRGPVFYRELRVGKNGGTIGLLKFRTFLLPVSRGPDRQVRADLRLSRAGEFLVKTSLDELPQLFNVIAGDLSLVGPRPLRQSELRIRDQGPLVDQLLALRPGLVSAAAVLAPERGLGWGERRNMDLRFHTSASFRTELLLLAMTLPAAVNRAGIVGGSNP